MPPRWMVALALLLASPAARADVRPSPPRCNVDGQGCLRCSRYLVPDPTGTAEFERCTAGARERGLVQTCEQRSGPTMETFFCPAGTRAPKTTTGCASCTVGVVDASEGAAALGLLAVGVGVLVGGRRRRMLKGLGLGPLSRPLAQPTSCCSK